jgi:tetratricopeptide (TPR) repeat protein
MIRTRNLISGCLLLALVVASGCKPKSSAPPISSNPSNYFQTPFQTESEFIVDAILTDLAEQMYYAKFHRLPDHDSFVVNATAKVISPTNAPVYQVRIRLDSKHDDLSLELPINGPIWSPAVYQSVAGELARTLGLSAGHAAASDDSALLTRLTDGTPETIELENQKLSAALESDFTNPALHEQAAVVLGAFLLREHSGYFYEIRSPLSRMTAHLAMAQFLNGATASDLNGRMAEAMLLTLINDEAPAVALLDTIGTNNAAVQPMVHTLRMRCTGDYRPLDAPFNQSPIENVERFYEMAGYIDAVVAWPKLSDEQKQAIDFVRVAHDADYSVEIGHVLLEASIPQEMQEVNSIYELSHHEKLSTTAAAVKALNELPQRCVTAGPGGAVHVQVIDWGQWAAFFQRHLCHAMQENFHFMYSMWGVPDDAKEFSARCDHEFGALRMYPFVKRFNCTDVDAYHKSVDDGFKLTVEAPQFVPANCWNYLCYRVGFAPWYRPNPNPHVNEWHNPNPPPGTAYDLHPRLDHPSLISGPDALARFEKLHDLAPYDCRIITQIINRKYKGQATFDQTVELYRPVLPYSVTALRAVANTVSDQPVKYEEYLLKVAELDPVCYYTLGDLALNYTNEDKAAKYYDQAAATDGDSVRVSYYADWRIKYLLKQGQVEKARHIADEAGEVYSSVGLQAKANFYETTSNYDGAHEWYAKVEERYDDPGPVLAFCARYFARTGDTRFQSELNDRLKKLFPDGIQKVSLSDFHDPPSDGVVIRQQNNTVRSAGLNSGDVIVSVFGVRVHNFKQYGYGRELTSTPEMDLIVWQGDAYHELKPSVPGHRFGVDIGDYPAK